MASNVRMFPPHTYPIANIEDRAKEVRASKFDIENKGYLTFEQLAAWYQSENEGRLPSIHDLSVFLGKPQHDLATEHLNGWEILQSRWLASTFKGDFRLQGFAQDPAYAPAGNVRIGREIGPQWDERGQRDVDQVVFLVDFNLINRDDFDGRVTSATIVVGPRGFAPEEGARHGEAAEVQLTALSEDGYMTYPMSRFGPSGPPQWVPEKKLLAAQVDTGDLRKLMGDSGGLSFYVRLETNDNKTFYINPEGQAFRNFEISSDEVAPQGNP